MHPDILIAEDEISLAILVADHLARLGYKASLANDGKEACSILESVTPEKSWILITDIQMPHMNGVELLKTVCASSWPVIGIIVTSALDDWDPLYQAARSVLMASGRPFQMLPKPFSAQVLDLALTALTGTLTRACGAVAPA